MSLIRAGASFKGLMEIDHLGPYCHGLLSVGANFVGAIFSLSTFSGIPENDLHRKMTPKQKSENDLHMNFVQMQNRKMTSIYFLVKFSKENDPQNKIGK